MIWVAGAPLSSRSVLAVLAKSFLGALRAQSEGQGNLFMHPQGDNLYGYGSHNTFSGLFQARFGGYEHATSTAF